MIKKSADSYTAVDHNTHTSIIHTSITKPQHQPNYHYNSTNLNLLYSITYCVNIQTIPHTIRQTINTASFHTLSQSIHYHSHPQPHNHPAHFNSIHSIQNHLLTPLRWDTHCLKHNTLYLVTSQEYLIKILFIVNWM